MKVNTIMNLACVRLDVKASDIRKVMRHKPEALTLFEERGDEMYPKYMVSVARCSDVCCIERFNDVGATFVDVDDQPVLWICLPDEAMEGKSAFIAEEYGVILNNISAIEKQIKDAGAVVAKNIDSVKKIVVDVFDMSDDEAACDEAAH